MSEYFMYNAPPVEIEAYFTNKYVLLNFFLSRYIRLEENECMMDRIFPLLNHFYVESNLKRYSVDASHSFMFFFLISFNSPIFYIKCIPYFIHHGLIRGLRFIRVE